MQNWDSYIDRGLISTKLRAIFGTSDVSRLALAVESLVGLIGRERERGSCFVEYPRQLNDELEEEEFCLRYTLPDARPGRDYHLVIVGGFGAKKPNGS